MQLFITSNNLSPNIQHINFNNLLENNFNKQSICNLCNSQKLSTTILQFTENSKYLIIRLCRRENLMINNLNYFNQKIGNLYWKLTATMEHIPGGIGHYCVWIKLKKIAKDG